jgi:hypothetical protein
MQLQVITFNIHLHGGAGGGGGGANNNTVTLTSCNPYLIPGKEHMK